jgi:acyl carrier protein
MQKSIQDWLSKHGITNLTPEQMNLPMSEIDGLDSILIMALIIEIEELIGGKIPKEIFLKIGKISINELILAISS